MERVLNDRDVQTTKFQKVILLRGILDGMMFGESPLLAPGSNAMYVDISYEYLIDALDQFYSDYRNEKIFVVGALLIVSMELRGEPKAKIEAAIQNFRQRASAAPMRQ